MNNIFRTPKLEHLAGDQNLIVNVIDNGLKITFDIEKVYYCTRLAYEWKWIIDKYIKNGDLILDMFCGVGPFSILAAKK